MSSVSTGPTKSPLRNSHLAFSPDAVRLAIAVSGYLIREVRPSYTRQAMRAQQQGRTFLERVVYPNGSVGEFRFLSGLLPSFGFDEKAVIAVKQWRFKPGTAAGREVPLIVTLELLFRLR
jgi:periplasmic protein TonB